MFPNPALTVLVATSDPHVRSDLDDALRELSLDVVSADSAAHAVKLLAERGPDVAFIAPGLDGGGASLVDELRTRQPDLPLLAILDAGSGLDAAQDGTWALHLPVEPDRLRVVMERVAPFAAMQRSLSGTRQALAAVLDAFPAPILRADNGEIIFYNRSLREYFGMFSGQSGAGQSLFLDEHIVEVDGEPFRGTAGEWVGSLLADTVDRDHLVRLSTPRLPDGRSTAFVAELIPLPIPGQVLVALRDVPDGEDSLAGTPCITDGLTGAMIRRDFMERLAMQEIRAHKSERAFSLILFSIDGMKNLNERLGQEVGDLILAETAELVRLSSRDHDLLCRWGGGRFMILASGANLERAKGAAERLRQALAKHLFTTLSRTVTASFGVAQYRHGERLDELVDRVENALNRAAQDGQTTVVSG